MQIRRRNSSWQTRSAPLAAPLLSLTQKRRSPLSSALQSYTTNASLSSEPSAAAYALSLSLRNTQLTTSQAFRNPPSAVASLFLTALTKTEEFCDTFDEVVFAIIEREGSGNMRPWKEVWEGEGVAVEEEVVADRVKEGRKGKHWWNR